MSWRCWLPAIRQRPKPARLSEGPGKGELSMSHTEITAFELKAKLESGERVTLIDVREPFEREIVHIGGTLIPVGEVVQRLEEIPRDHPVVVYCKSGGRSGSIVEGLQKSFGFTNLINLKGGVLGWRRDVDPKLPGY